MAPTLQGLSSRDARDRILARAVDSTLTPPWHEADIEDWKNLIGPGLDDQFGGNRTWTGPDCFPAHFGATSRQIDEALLSLQHRHEANGSAAMNKVALDMGCGNLALGLRLAGMDCYDKVLGLDNHGPAVESAQKNIERSRFKDKVEVFQSDLLSGIEGRLPLLTGRTPPTFDTIVFNQPYYPREGNEYGLGPDGGAAITRKFFESIKPYTHSKTEIIMPYSSDVPTEHNPAKIAAELGYQVSKLSVFIAENGTYHIVYRFVKEDVFNGKLTPAIYSAASRRTYGPAPVEQAEVEQPLRLAVQPEHNERRAAA